MKMPVTLALCLLAAAPAVGEPAPPPQRRGDQVEAFEARRQGKILPLREIERRIVPQMPGSQYLGVELDSYSGIYTLKFLRNGTVIWVEVDGASGRIVGRTGN
ncbi:PepSY domain-containing protein [Sphingomonas sp. GB1N7]|uniref:PepSY domain-containing protein n=1 Tax=Parasphingomonas caseinilytica TaxID=3096158 RepID=UPI002FC61EDC